MTSSPEDIDNSDGVRHPRVGTLLSVARRLVASAVSFIFNRRPMSHSRRALLQGRWWKLMPESRFAPLVTRIPQPHKEDAPPRRTIGGITIEPVPPTRLGGQPFSPSVPLHRPPGAIDEFQFLAGCTRCGDCIAACPFKAIVLAPERLGKAAGTPVIEADHAACMMCVDFPCIEACQPGVLVASIPPIMGTARITAQLCLAYHHTTCTVCSERCPVPGAIHVYDGKPAVDEDKCTGCGVCRYVCPAPENAILLMPAFSRPGVPKP